MYFQEQPKILSLSSYHMLISLVHEYIMLGSIFAPPSPPEPRWCYGWC